jgi:hypothetical protein
MSENPKITVIDRRKFKAEEEQDSASAQAAAPDKAAASNSDPASAQAVQEIAKQTDTEQENAGQDSAGSLPFAPSAAESRVQQDAYEASAQRVDDLLRAQNPGMGPEPPITFESLVQQFYVSAMIQMGAGTPEGQRPRVDIVGARTTIDLLGVLAEKTRGNLSENESRTLETVLFETRMTFLELTSMIGMKGVPPPPGPR